MIERFLRMLAGVEEYLKSIGGVQHGVRALVVGECLNDRAELSLAKTGVDAQRLLPAMSIVGHRLDLKKLIF